MVYSVYRPSSLDRVNREPPIGHNGENEWVEVYFEHMSIHISDRMGVRNWTRKAPLFPKVILSGLHLSIGNQICGIQSKKKGGW